MPAPSASSSRVLWSALATCRTTSPRSSRRKRTSARAAPLLVAGAAPLLLTGALPEAAAVAPAGGATQVTADFAASPAPAPAGGGAAQGLTGAPSPTTVGGPAATTGGKVAGPGPTVAFKASRAAASSTSPASTRRSELIAAKRSRARAKRSSGSLASCGDAGLALEAAHHRLFVENAAARQDGFDRHLAVEHRVAAAVNPAHRALADQR